MTKIEIRYNWRFFDEVRGKHFVTRYKCTEEFIRRSYPDAVAVEHTREELEILDDLDGALKSTSMAHFNTGSLGKEKSPP